MQAVQDQIWRRGQVESLCEHHDGVSRHKYRYVPPMTLVGFWNFEFDSETSLV